MASTKSSLIATMLVSLAAALLILLYLARPGVLIWYGWVFGVIGAVRVVIATYRWTK